MKFDYELFYDFIKSNEAKEKRYQILCDDLLSETESFENYLFEPTLKSGVVIV